MSSCRSSAIFRNSKQTFTRDRGHPARPEVLRPTGRAAVGREVKGRCESRTDGPVGFGLGRAEELLNQRGAPGGGSAASAWDCQVAATASGIKNTWNRFIDVPPPHEPAFPSCRPRTSVDSTTRIVSVSERLDANSSSTCK